MNIIKKITIILILVVFLLMLLVLIINYYVSSSGKAYIKEMKDLENADAVIVLGAQVHKSGTPSDMLEDRLKMGLDIYNSGCVDKILLTGDHGREEYDEVNNMRRYMEDRGIKKEDIFMDHAGFNTYDSMYRLKEIFKVKKVIIVTQEYHLVRALYIAKSIGIDVQGVTSDLRTYPGIEYYKARDFLARFKAFLYVNIKAKPKFLGEEIPISGDGRLTHDIND